MEMLAVNLLCALGFEHIKVEIKLETVFQVEVESGLQLQLCWLTLLMSWITLHILFLNPDEVAIDIFLAEVIMLAHRLDEIDDMLFVSALTWSTLNTELCSPINGFTGFCLWWLHNMRRLIKMWKLFILLFSIVTLNGRDNHITGGLRLLCFFLDILHFKCLLYFFQIISNGLEFFNDIVVLNLKLATNLSTILKSL